MISKRFTHPCVIIDMLSDVWVEVFVGDTRSNVMIDTLSDEKVDVIIDVVFEIIVEVLVDVKANVLAVATTSLSFAMPAP